MSKRKPVFYVYELIDPSSNTIFYVGKGMKSRYCVHESLSKQGKHYNKHLENKIHQIWNCGETVIRKILLRTDNWRKHDNFRKIEKS